MSKPGPASARPKNAVRRHAWQRYGPLGGHPVLAFVNTVDDAGKSRQENAIPDLPTFAAWAQTVGLLSQAEAQGLETATGEKDYTALLRFREIAWRVLSTVARGEAADEPDLRALDEVVRDALSRSVLEQRPEGFAREAILGPDLARARLAIGCDDLLRGADLGRLRECERCTALFLDFSRGVGRRFCRAETCGNRAKVQRFRTKG